MKLTKRDLAQSLYEHNPEISLKAYQSMVTDVLRVLSENLQSLEIGDKIELRGIGTFFARERGSYTARNPKNGEIVKVKPRKHVHFLAGSFLQDKS